MSGEHSLAGRRPTWVEIDLDRLVANYRAVNDHLPSGVTVMAVVKADGYGHGAVRVAGVDQHIVELVVVVNQGGLE